MELNQPWFDINNVINIGKSITIIILILEEIKELKELCRKLHLNVVENGKILLKIEDLADSNDLLLENGRFSLKL